MAIPIVHAPVYPQDFKLNPIRVHKRFVIGSSSYSDTGSGYRKWDAIYLGEKLKIGAPSSTYPTNSIDGTNKHIIWNHFDTLYYRFPYDKVGTLEHANSRYAYKSLNLSASILSIPQHDFGEGIKPGSVEITSSGNTIMLRDDGNGNLYDPSISTGSFLSRNNLVAFWNFDETFKKFKYRNNALIAGDIPFISHTFTPDRPSVCKNITLSTPPGLVPLTGSRFLGERFFATFNYFNYPSRDSYILTDNRPEFNFSSIDDFTIAFWTYSADPTIGTVMSKNGTIFKQSYGTGYIEKEYGISENSNYYSQSYVNESTNVYPYDFVVSASGHIYFKRSDGIATLTLSASNFPADGFRHVAVTKSGSQCSLYINGILRDSGTDRTLNPINNHCLMFGARSMVATDCALMGLQDVRFYDRAFPQSNIQTLAASQSLQMYQSAVVGNVFYKTGNIVLTSNVPSYREILTNPTIRWKSTHTIYEYECLVRIKKGSFNLSQNPSALKSPNSDLLKDDFTGSLYPYATTIGLYNDTGELMAVGKLGQSIQMRDDVDINILMKLDT